MRTDYPPRDEVVQNPTKQAALQRSEAGVVGPTYTPSGVRYAVPRASKLSGQPAAPSACPRHPERFSTGSSGTETAHGLAQAVGVSVAPHPRERLAPTGGLDRRGWGIPLGGRPCQTPAHRTTFVPSRGRPARLRQRSLPAWGWQPRLDRLQAVRPWAVRHFSEFERDTFAPPPGWAAGFRIRRHTGYAGPSATMRAGGPAVSRPPTGSPADPELLSSATRPGPGRGGHRVMLQAKATGGQTRSRPARLAAYSPASAAATSSV